jgi:hypothetical protein
MTTTVLAKNSDRQLAHSLNEIPPLIKERLGRIEEAQKDYNDLTLQDKKEIGELLVEAKEQVKHGEWGPWLRKNFKWGITTAYEYMRLAQISPRGNLAKTTLADVLRKHVNPNHDKPPAWKEEIKQQTIRAYREMKQFQLQERSRREEREAERKLALRLISIGYKVLSVELHPDKGGSHETMRRLNAVRNRLKEAA